MFDENLTENELENTWLDAIELMNEIESSEIFKKNNKSVKMCLALMLKAARMTQAYMREDGQDLNCSEVFSCGVDFFVEQNRNVFNAAVTGLSDNELQSFYRSRRGIKLN